MFAWESLYSIKVGGIAPHVSEISEAMAKDGHEMLSEGELRHRWQFDIPDG
jgi:hypothetical protein